jgi:hypothetical protein
MKNIEQSQQKTNGFIDKPKTLIGWIGFITTLLGMIGVVMAFGAWVYKMENHEHVNTDLRAGIVGINTRLDEAVKIIDSRFRSIEETQTDLRIAIEVAAKLEQVRGISNSYNRVDVTVPPRRVNFHNNPGSNPGRNPGHNPSSNLESVPSTLIDLEFKLNQIDERLVNNYNKEFKF